jgi:hypothetical protein
VVADELVADGSGLLVELRGRLDEEASSGHPGPTAGHPLLEEGADPRLAPRPGQGGTDDGVGELGASLGQHLEL